MDTFQLESSLQTIIGKPSEWKIQLHSALQSRGKSQTRWSYYTSAVASLLNYVTRDGNDPCRKSLVSKRHVPSIGSQRLVKLVGPVTKKKEQNCSKAIQTRYIQKGNSNPMQPGDKMLYSHPIWLSSRNISLYLKMIMRLQMSSNFNNSIRSFTIFFKIFTT